MNVQTACLTLLAVSSLAASGGCDQASETPEGNQPESAASPQGKRGDAAQPAESTKPETDGVSAQTELRATVGEKPLKTLYAFAQLDEAGGERYRITDAAGAGGMGRVFAATDTRLERRVAGDDPVGVPDRVDRGVFADVEPATELVDRVEGEAAEPEPDADDAVRDRWLSEIRALEAQGIS